jgi:hypothetical protein
VLALLVWAVSVFVLPSTPGFLARELVPAVSPTYAMIRTLRAEKERNEALARLRAPLRERGLTDLQIEAQIDSAAVKRIWDRFWERKREENQSHERSLLQGAITAVVLQGSPYSAFTLGGCELSGVGIASLASYVGFSKGQGQALDQYLKQKWEAAAKANPDLKRSDRLDTSDRPRGEYGGDRLAYRLAGAAIPLLSLGLFNVVFFALSWRRFLVYDIR